MEDLLQQGRAAYKAGNIAEAKASFIDAIRQNRDNERAWMALYGTLNNDHERIKCLQEILRINPNNQKAKQFLDQLTNDDAWTQAQPVVTSSTNAQTQDLSLKKCPYCAEMIQADAVVCRFCGRDLITGIVNTSVNMIAQPPKPKKWYMATWVKILTFLFVLPLWVLIVLEDPDSSLGVKITAGVLLVIYILIICPSTYRLFTHG